MGDCRIRVSIAKELLQSKGQDSLQAKASPSISIVKTYAADTTIREVVEDIPQLWDLYKEAEVVSVFQLWDCTYHPPKDITDWPSKAFCELAGPKSKTLQSAGCFPSGTWLALPRGVPPSQYSNTKYEDPQYNQHHNENLASVGKVEFAASSLVSDLSRPNEKILPSQVMAAVTQRFSNQDQNREEEAHKARVTRRENEAESIERQRLRAAKLDERIRKLEASTEKKNKKVSNQVRRMLVKSRATGDKNLKQQDRLYFECILDRGDGDGEDGDQVLNREFRFFSLQDTFAKIGGSFTAPPKERGLANVEVLIKTHLSGDGGISEYRRLPVAMRVYEAKSEKFLSPIDGQEVDTLIVRWFSDRDDATPNILDQAREMPMMQGSDASMKEAKASSPTSLEEEAVSQVDQQANDSLKSDLFVENNKLSAAIQAMDEEGRKGKKLKKKASAAATKVRNMQIKSKAIGDAKRIPKVEDRFFLEVVLIDKVSGKATCTFQYLAKKDPLDRLLRTMDVQNKQSSFWDFLVPQGDDSRQYKRISDPSIALASAASQGMIQPFDRLVLSPK